MSYDTFKIEQCWTKLHSGFMYTTYNAQSKEEKRQLCLIYEWVKNGHIGKKEFLTLINGVISGDIEIAYGEHSV